jgi:hypothetical protein
MPASMQTILEEHQNVEFDRVYVDAREIDHLISFINRKKSALHPLNSRKYFLLYDLGGGNGSFCDSMISRLPTTRAVNVEISEALININKKNQSKTVMKQSLLDFLPQEKADLVSLNYVLHHLVGNDIRASYALVARSLHNARRMIDDHGTLLIFENVIVGRISDELSTRVLFSATSSRWMARVSRRLGANTGGVGVLYLGEAQLKRLVEAAGFRLRERFMLRQPRRNAILNAVLAREIRRMGFLFEPIRP